MLSIGSSKVLAGAAWAMAAGLFIQLTGKVLYASGSANGVHVYLLLILPSLLCFIWSTYSKTRVLASEAQWFLLSAAVFLAVCSVSAFWSDGDDSPLYVLRKSLVILLYLYAVVSLVTVAQWRHMRWFLVGICCVAAVGALLSLGYQLLVLDESFGWRTFRIYRMGYGQWVDLGYPVISGIYFGLFAVLAASLLTLEHRRRGLSLLLTLVMVALLPYVFQTFSRTSWVAAMVATGYLLVAFRNRMILVLGTILAGIGLLLAFYYYDHVVVELTERQLSGRPTIWLWTLNSFLEQPVWGHGFGHSFWPEKAFAHAHNFLLQVMFEQGLVGLLGFLAMLYSVFRSAWVYRQNREVLAAFALVVYILTAMMVDVQHVITRPGLFWTIFWFPLGLVVGLVNRQRMEEIHTKAGPLV